MKTTRCCLNCTNSYLENEILKCKEKQIKNISYERSIQETDCNKFNVVKEVDVILVSEE